mmetsp:Transcript_3642/g.3733  ORF Transcript_3642/g.3733 Transcript_3642/m.3733 type:complete len:91 (-) Transcript_3642:107-379(-)|eukprot:CAMPEP_0171312630 /NCGR_PEP_ID=MMETSP0816-20121228/26796_1 /TAXON_ID=420281 /ORGANISM="Proboscia inermis, Strain CCAP1064/1" /LENGTH=90 /DNA_ID=CAMNT_0011798271 /DNA_START=64 /DNA_END=336 /DNA_ORIENTATION=-
MNWRYPGGVPSPEIRGDVAEHLSPIPQGWGILVRVVCLLNHPHKPDKQQAATKIRNLKGRTVMEVTQVLEKGGELTYSYGDLTNKWALLV